MKKLILSNGMNYGIGSNGEKICTGAQMGRQNILPQNIHALIKLHLCKLPMVDRDYDAGGCYWGATPDSAIYCAHDGWDFTKDNSTLIFVRASSRQGAKEKVREHLSNAKFYR